MSQRHRGLRLAAVLCAALGCAAPTAPDSPPALLPAGTFAASSAVSSAILEATNAERSKAGLAPLKKDIRLSQAAQLQSNQMAAAARLEHEIPDAPYPSPPDRLAAANYSWRAYAENIATGQSGASAVVSQWMQSPGHRTNILNKTYLELGVGYAVDARGRPYYTQVFGIPAP